MPRHALIALILLASCQKLSPEEQARRDARDVAMVEAAQHVLPPSMPLVPQALGPAELGAGNLPCRFGDPAHAAGAPILAAGPERALMRVGGRAVLFASDTGSASLPRGAWVHYSGKATSLRLDPMPTRENMTPAGPAQTLSQPMTLTIHDEHDRPVLEATGQLTCGEG